MSFVTDVLTPLVQGLIYVGIAGTIMFLIWRVLKDNLPKWKVYITYKVFRKPYPERDIEWTYDAIKKRMTWLEMVKIMLKKGNSDEQIATINLIHKDISKKLKGGVNYGK